MKTKLLRLMLVVAFGSVLLRGNQAAALTLNGDQSTDSTWDNYYFLIQNFSVADPVTITSLEIYSFTNATATYSVHYRAGDYLGFETDPNSWSQACSVVLAPPAPPAPASSGMTSSPPS